MPPGLIGEHSATADGRRICYAFNVQPLGVSGCGGRCTVRERLASVLRTRVLRRA